LVIIFHHLIADAFSISIIFEDFLALYQQLDRGEAIQLPPKTTSVKRWAERLTAYAQSAESREELTYWLAESRYRVRRLPVDYPEGENTEASARFVRRTLSPSATSTLVRATGKEDLLTVDLLMAALVQTMEQWTGNPLVLIMPLGHGRETLFEDVDLGRTVGWLSTGVPVLFDVEAAHTPAEVLRMVKAQFRQVPHHGLGYGALRSLCADLEVSRQLRALPLPDLMFNYLGLVEAPTTGPGMARPARESSGPMIGGQNNLPTLLHVIVGMRGGQLQVQWLYSSNLYRSASIEALAQDYLEAIRRLIAVITQ
jgi:non-ribosomal peptide synthase protein (TIGR01720 family)